MSLERNLNSLGPSKNSEMQKYASQSQQDTYFGNGEGQPKTMGKSQSALELRRPGGETQNQ